MSIKYSGAARTGQFSGGTRLEIVNNLKDALVSAGWTVASGASGDWKLNSGITPSGHQIRVRLYDPGGSYQCARARIMNVPETIAPATDMFLQAVSGRVYRWFANPYQFFVLAPGTIAARSFLAAGIPWLPSFLSAAYCGWMGCNAISDTDTSQRSSLRGGSYGLYFGTPNQAAIYGDTGWGASNTAADGNIGVLWRICGDVTSNLRAWMDGSLSVYEPIIGWGPASVGDYGRLVGQLWDAIVVEGEWGMDEIINFDNKQWWCIYYRYVSGPTVTLAVLYPTT